MVKNNAYNEKIAMNFFLEISYYCINSFRKWSSSTFYCTVDQVMSIYFWNGTLIDLWKVLFNKTIHVINNYIFAAKYSQESMKTLFLFQKRNSIQETYIYILFCYLFYLIFCWGNDEIFVMKIWVIFIYIIFYKLLLSPYKNHYSFIFMYGFLATRRQFGDRIGTISIFFH